MEGRKWWIRGCHASDGDLNATEQTKEKEGPGFISVSLQFRSIAGRDSQEMKRPPEQQGYREIRLRPEQIEKSRQQQKAAKKDADDGR